MNWIDKVFNSLLSYSGWVTCVVYVIKIKTTKRHKNESVAWDLNLYKKKIHLFVFPSKTIWELYSLFTPIMYKLIGNGRL